MTFRPYPCPTDVSPTRPSDPRAGLLVRVSRTTYPDGGERLTVARVGTGSGRQLGLCPTKGGYCPFDRHRIRRNLDNEARKVRRARQSVSDYARCNGLDHLVTLTAGKHPRSRGHALDLWSGYLDDPRDGRWLRDYLKQCYVAVAEPFDDGDGWHVHVCVRGRLPVPVLLHLKESWTRHLADRHGIARPENVKHRQWRVNVKAPRRRDTPCSLGRYVSKYVGKSFDAHTLPGEHRYRSGRGMLEPERESGVLRLSLAAIDALFEGFPPRFELTNPVTGLWLGWTSERRGSP